AVLYQLLTAVLNDERFARCAPGPTSVSDLIEGCGVPRTVGDLILATGETVDFSYLVKDGDHISIYPVFRSLNIPRGHRLQEPLLSASRFLVDVNLGKLARYLRIAGFDAAYQNDAEDDELLARM